MFVTVGNKLYTLVNALVASTDLEAVYNYERKLGDGGYPYVTITPVATTEVVYMTGYNLMQVAFNITVYVRNTTIATQENVIRTLVDSILVALRADEYLTGTAVQSRFDIERAYAGDEQPVRLATIKATYGVFVAA